MDLSAIPQLAGIIEKGGIVGLLVIICAFLLWQLVRYQKELVKAYRERDRWRIAFVKAKATCDNVVPPIKIDLSDLNEIVGYEK